MSDEIGHVTSGKGHRFVVSWDRRNAYVKDAGGLAFGATWEKVGSADSAGEAMRKAEAFVYNR
jgi:hypothetical protein